MAFASTALASPALARDDSVYVGIDGGVVFGGSLGSDFDLDFDDVTPGVQNRVDIDGDLKIKSVMANALVDLGPDDGLQFFVGGGAGIGWADFEGSFVDEEDAFIDDSDGAFAWQLMAGARLPLSDAVDIGVKYKYFNLDNLNIRNVDENRIDTGLSSHSVLASRAFNFGGHARGPAGRNGIPAEQARPAAPHRPDEPVRLPHPGHLVPRSQ